MAKVIKQFRYWPESNTEEENKPRFTSNITPEAAKDGSAFAGQGRIVSLGIQALPGTAIYINGGTEPLIIGNSGIYQIDVEDELTINTLRADLDSYADFLNAGIIFDIIYETEDNL